jgi:hypothetical protein
MKKGWLLLLGAVMLLVGMCAWFSWLWYSEEQPRFSHDFDIGGGRIVRVWSNWERDWIEPGPRGVYYRVDQQGKEVVHRTFLESDDGGKYVFKAILADAGRLACIYETTRAKSNSSYLLMFDAASGESWPRLGDDETEDVPGVMEKWRERYRRLKTDNPELPTPHAFEE